MSSSGRIDLTEEEQREFHEIFQLVDTANRGFITRLDLYRLMKTLRLRPTEAEMAGMLSEANASDNNDDSTAVVTYDQFAQILGRRVRSEYTPEQLRGAFRVFQTDDVPEGCVSSSTLRQALCSYGTNRLSEDEAARLVAAVDPEDTGLVNYIDFVDMVKGEKGAP